tara:strand:- start:1049 stop:1387 length:339 start_codon:yes stop_codon:yes gene_type:complete
MKPIIIENSRIPKYLSIFISIWAITLYPFIICKGQMNKTTLNHEKIHLAQQRELWLIGFYPLYVFYWLKLRLFSGLNNEEAYRAIPFEKEAYAHETDEEYLSKRERFAWRHL